MRRPLAFVGVLTVCALVPGLNGAEQDKPSAPSSPDKPVTSATVRVVRKSVDVAWVTIENNRDVPIAEWAVEIYRDAAARQPTSTLYAFRWSDLRSGGPFTPGNGPIAPGEARRIRMDRDFLPLAVRLTRVVLADGSYDGTAAETLKLLQNGTKDGVVGRPSSLKPVALLSSIPVRFELGTATNFVVELENKRDVPLEAWSIQVRTSPVSGYGGYESDNAVAPLIGPENTRLQPNAKREVTMAPADGIADSDTPETQVLFALWQDLSFEGPAARREALFRERERKAAQFAFWIDALREAARRPLDAGKLLEAKRAERRKTNPNESDLLSGDLQQWSAGARATPAQAAARLEVYADQLWQQAQRLTRHLPR